MGDKPYIYGAADWAFSDACDVINQGLEKIVDRYYNTNLDFDISASCDIDSEFYDHGGLFGTILVIINFDGLNDDESAECSSDEIIKNVINDVMAYLNEFVYVTDYESDNEGLEYYEPIEFYCAVGHYMDPVKAIRLINELKTLAGEMNIELSNVKDLCNTPERLNDVLNKSSAPEETKQAFRESCLAVKDMLNEIEANEGRIIEAFGRGFGKTDMLVELHYNLECFFSNVELV